MRAASGHCSSTHWGEAPAATWAVSVEEEGYDAAPVGLACDAHLTQLCTSAGEAIGAETLADGRRHRWAIHVAPVGAAPVPERWPVAPGYVLDPSTGRMAALAADDPRLTARMPPRRPGR